MALITKEVIILEKVKTKWDTIPKMTPEQIKAKHAENTEKAKQEKRDKQAKVAKRGGFGEDKGGVTNG